PLGDVYRPRGRLEGAARMAWLASLHGGYAADRRGLPAEAVAEAASYEHDGNPRSLSPAGLDSRRCRTAQGDRRLQAVAAQVISGAQEACRADANIACDGSRPATRTAAGFDSVFHLIVASARD